MKIILYVSNILTRIIDIYIYKKEIQITLKKYHTNIVFITPRFYNCVEKRNALKMILDYLYIFLVSSE